MGIQEVQAALENVGLAQRYIELKERTATVEEAARALHCDPEQIAKTIAFNVNNTPVVIVAAGNTKIDNAKFKAFFGCKAQMFTPEETLERVGHAVGGVCPFGVKPEVKIYLDLSVKQQGTIYPAAGSSNSVLELTPDELEKALPHAEWVDVTKLKG